MSNYDTARAAGCTPEEAHNYFMQLRFASNASFGLKKLYEDSANQILQKGKNRKKLAAIQSNGVVTAQDPFAAARRAYEASGTSHRQPRPPLGSLPPRDPLARARHEAETACLQRQQEEKLKRQQDEADELQKKKAADELQREIEADELRKKREDRYQAENQLRVEKSKTITTRDNLGVWWLRLRKAANTTLQPPAPLGQELKDLPHRTYDESDDEDSDEEAQDGFVLV